MKAIGSGGEWWRNLPSLRRKSDSRRRGRRSTDPRGRRRGPPREPLSSSSSESVGQSSSWPIEFPFRQALTAASLTFTGDTIAQVRGRIVDRRRRGSDPDSKELIPDILLNHDWLRGFRMASYGFLLYGPGSYAWYQFLDRCMPKQSFVNLSAKVILNQIVLGPCVIAVVFAWNNLWLGKLSELPSKYQNDALPTLLYGFKFWIPVSIVNFGICMSLVHHVIYPQHKIYARVIGYIHPTEENVKEIVSTGITVHCKVSSSSTVPVDQHKVTVKLIQDADEHNINGGRDHVKFYLIMYGAGAPSSILTSKLKRRSIYFLGYVLN